MTTSHIYHDSLGNDLITGSSGDDTIYSAHGSDMISAGNGNDDVEVTSLDKHVIVDGGDGDDSITASREGSYVISGGNGADNINVYSGNATILGGDGNDQITVGLTGGNWNYHIDAGNGDDYVTVFVGNTTIDAGAGNDVVYAYAGNNVIHTGTGNDQVYIYSGKAAVDAGDGNDYVDISSALQATVHGGSGADTVVAYANFNFKDTTPNKGVLFGEDGNDRFDFDGGSYTVSGGAGSNSYIFENLYFGTFASKVTITDFNPHDHMNFVSQYTVSVLADGGIGIKAENADIKLLSIFDHHETLKEAQTFVDAHSTISMYG